MSAPGPTEPEPDAPDPPDAAERKRDPVDHVLGVLREEPLLWPVAAVTGLVLATFGGFVLFYALVVRTLAGGVALLFLIFFTVWGLDRDIRERRLSLRNGLVLTLWVASGLCALALRLLGA